MKQYKKTLFVLALFGLLITSCNKVDNGDNNNDHNSDARYAIYQLAVNEGYDGTYQEWLDSIKGQDGKDGHSPVIEISPEGNWLIDGVDTGVSAKGKKGDQGPQGEPGIPGLQGDQGNEGPEGAPGKDGHSVLSGTSNPNMSDGNVGDIYINSSSWDCFKKENNGWVLIGNIKGQQGEAGKDGAPGEDGNPGEQGPRGPQGTQGIQGNPGEDGKSAYELYIEAHPDYEKDEDEWLDDLINGRLANKEVHTVTFNDRWNNVPSQLVLHGEKIEKPNDLVHDHYIFEGWFYNDELWSFGGNVVTCDMTLTSKWSKAYDVTYLDDDDTVLYSGLFRKDEEIKYPYGVPTKEEDNYVYQFEKWEVIEKQNDDIVLKAKYQMKSNHLSIENGIVCKYSGEENEVIIPTSWDGYQVTRIRGAKYNNLAVLLDYGAFFANEYVENIVIPEGVTHIDEYAFARCKNLKSITLPQSLLSIEDSAFEDCYSLENINIPDNVTYIGERAFYNCYHLNSLTIGRKVSNIGKLAFSCCDSLKTIYVNSGNKTFDSRDESNAIINRETDTLIFGCGNTTIPNNVKIIGAHAFAYCYSLNKIKIPNNVTKIEKFAFRDCINLSQVKLGEGVKEIGENAFIHCDKLIELYYALGDEINSIIGSSHLGDKVQAFHSNLSDESIILSDGKFNYFLAEVELIPMLPVTVSVIINYYGEDEIVTVPTLFHGNFVILWHQSFAGNRIIKEVTIERYTYAMGNSCFRDCAALEKITILGDDDGFDVIPPYMFYGCSSLKEVILPSAMTSINEFAFYECSSLETINLPNNITNIGRFAFAYCDNLNEITLPNNINSMGESAFMWSYSLNTVTYEGIEYLGSENNPYLCLIHTSDTTKESYAIHEDTKIIMSNSLENLTNIEELVIPEGVLSICDYAAFYNNINLKYVILPNSIKYVGLWFVNISRVKAYYYGTTSDWDNVSNPFEVPPVYFYNELEPTDTGNYWRYVDNKPVEW